MIAVGTPVVSDGTRRLYLGAGLVGTAAFLYGVVLGDAIRAWQSLLVNFLFFGGLAQAGVVLSAMMQVTSSRWGRALKRTAEATSAFLPVSFVLLLVLLAGVSAWAPWVQAPVEAQAGMAQHPVLRHAADSRMPAARRYQPGLRLPVCASGHRAARPVW